MWHFLEKEHTIAGPSFNRWLVPPAALAIHLCIGMAYGFSVFWKPMANLLPATDAACTAQSFMQELFTTSCNWSIPSEVHIFETFIAMLGISAALWGSWVEHSGPRKSGFLAAFCWGGGLIVGGIGISVHQLWLVYLGCGVLGGVGQGLGYITPVSTLIKWFPDRRGMATGFAIMGYGGGAMIGAPLAVYLMQYFKVNNALGVSSAMITMGIIYFVVMSCGAFGFRIAPTGWKPLGWHPKESTSAMVTNKHVHLNHAWKTKQFWLIWAVLLLNVTAGIGVLSMASVMFQDVLGPSILGLSKTVTDLTVEQKAAIAAAAAGLVGLISLSNSLGRLAWASVSDLLGRKATYAIFFTLGIATYCSLPYFGHAGLAGMFVLAVCLILTMYGGGFSTVPAYLADIFGTQMVGAIHGRLLTAWSVAGIVGPFIIAAVRQAQLDSGVAKALVYDRTLYIMAGLLAVGFICNLMVTKVKESDYMSDEELQKERAIAHDSMAKKAVSADTAARGSFGLVGVLAWVAIGTPFLIGVWIAFSKAAALF